MFFVAAPAATGNGDFGDWAAFSQQAPTPTMPSTELFGGTQHSTELFAGSATQTAHAPSNAPDLFDLMGASHATMSTSQSMNLSMMNSSTVGITLPMSRSQVSPICILVEKPGNGSNFVRTQFYFISL